MSTERTPAPVGRRPRRAGPPWAAVLVVLLVLVGYQVAQVTTPPIATSSASSTARPAPTTHAVTVAGVTVQVPTT